MCSSPLLLSCTFFFLHEKFTIFHTGKIHYPHSRIATGQGADCAIKQQSVSSTAETEQLAQQHVRFLHLKSDFMWCIVGGEFFSKWRGWSTTTSNVRGRSWSTLHLPISYLPQSHGFSPGRVERQVGLWEWIRSTQPLPAEQRQLPI